MGAHQELWANYADGLRVCVDYFRYKKNNRPSAEENFTRVNLKVCEASQQCGLALGKAFSQIDLLIQAGMNITQHHYGLHGISLYVAQVVSYTYRIGIEHRLG